MMRIGTDVTTGRCGLAAACNIHNSNPARHASPRRKLVEDSGFEIAFDGKEIAL